MRTTDSINELAQALAKAQSEIKDAMKDSKNPHFKNDYASLSSVLEAIREPLSKNGLSLLQATKINPPQGEVPASTYLVSKLMHASGQWIESDTPLLFAKHDMQGLGSAMTYARRYAIAAMCGISQKDDDGEASIDRNTYPEDVRKFAAPYTAQKTQASVMPKVGQVTRVTLSENKK